MKKSLLIFLVLITSFFSVFSQTVEKVFETDEVKYKSGDPARFGPYGICIDEVNDLIEIMNG
ncbi:MAG: YARHG domain-containing protein, partial [Treponema sp.]|nr:YARHG domain-containing protein [Treponema sp.]